MNKETLKQSILDMPKYQEPQHKYKPMVYSEDVLSLVDELDTDVCKWQFDDDGYFTTSCELWWNMSNEAGLKENNMNYCPKCGKPIREME